LDEEPEERFGLLRVGFGDDLFEVVGNGCEVGARGRVVRLVGRLKRELGLLGAEIVQTGLEAG
jgi:hypothetical protein